MGERLSFKKPRLSSSFPTNPIQLRDAFLEASSSQDYYKLAKSGYRFWTPNFTIAGMDKLNFFVKRFNFTGTHLIAFGAGYRSIEVYRYCSVDRAYDLLEKIETDQDYIENLPRIDGEAIFDRILTHSRSIYIETEEVFSRDICLFHHNNRHMIAVTKRITNEDYNFFQRYQNSESLFNPVYPNDNGIMETLRFYLIDYLNGNIESFVTIECDKLVNCSVDLFCDKFMFFSAVHQTIYLYHIDENYKFVFMRSIGRFCLEDDEFFDIQAYRSNLTQRRITPFREGFSTMMKQKFKLFIYKKFMENSSKSQNWYLEFFRKVRTIESFVITKIQFISEREFLIKYECPTYYEHFVIGNFVLGPWMFVFYDWNLGIFKDIHSNTDCMVKYFENNFNNLMKHHNPHHRICTIGNSAQMRYSYENSKDLMNARSLTSFQRNQLIIQSLPFKAQSFCASPYLDMEFFKYNEIFISPHDHIRTIQPFIQFWDQSNNQPLFRLFFYDESNHSLNHFRDKRAIEFILHPTEPFIISVYCSMNDIPVFNLHLHRPNTVQKEAKREVENCDLIHYFSKRPHNVDPFKFT